MLTYFSVSLNKSTSLMTSSEYDDPGYLTPLNTTAPKEQKKKPSSHSRPPPKQLITLNGVHGNSITEYNAPVQSLLQTKNGSPKKLKDLPVNTTNIQQRKSETANAPATNQNGHIRESSDILLKSAVIDNNSISLDEIPKPKNFVSDSGVSDYTDVNEALLGQKDNTVPEKETPIEGDYVKDISMLMKPISSTKNKSNDDLSSLGYVTIEQLKSKNLI